VLPDLPDLWLRAGLIGLIAVVLLVPLVWRMVRRRFDPFEPIVLFAVAYGVMFVARPASMIATGDLVYEGPRTALNVSNTFSEMLLVAFVGALAFVVGYELHAGGRLASLLRGFDELDLRRAVAPAVIVAAIGASSFLLFLASSEGLSTVTLMFRGRSSELAAIAENTSFYVWYSFFLLVPASLILLVAGLERRNKALIVTALALGALFMLRTIPVGGRIAALPFFGGLLVLYYLRRSARPSPLTLVVLAAVALVTSSFLSDLRGRATRDDTVAETFVRATKPSRIASPFLAGPDSEMAPVLSAALGVIPERLSYTHGSSIFGDLISRPVPRALWSDKPRPPRDELIAALWPIESQRGTVNPEFSALLYFYWDFGVLGVAVGLLLYGVGARLLYEYFLRHRSSLAVQVLYSIALWFVVIGVRNSLVDTIVQAAFIVFPAWLIFRIAASWGVRSAAIIPR
jgi:hypothetical protein